MFNKYFIGVAGAVGVMSYANTLSAACVTLPTCYELGYTKSAAECLGHDYLKCPFDQSRGYCDLSNETTPVIQTCESLGYTKIAKQCSGFELIECPLDSTKYKCGDAIEPEKPKYNVGDPYSVNGAVIGAIIEVNGTILTVASAPVYINESATVSESDLNKHCTEISYSGALWYPLNNEQAKTAYGIFKTVLGSAALVANSGNNNEYLRITYCKESCSNNEYLNAHYISCRAAFVAE